MQPTQAHVSSDFTAERHLAITPDLAGWSTLTFRTYTFSAGKITNGEAVDDEVCMLFLSGKAVVQVGQHSWTINGRASVFDGLPYCIYLPPQARYILTPHTDCQLAYARARSTGQL